MSGSLPSQIMVHKCIVVFKEENPVLYTEDEGISRPSISPDGRPHWHQWIDSKLTKLVHPAYLYVGIRMFAFTLNRNFGYHQDMLQV